MINQLGEEENAVEENENTEEELQPSKSTKTKSKKKKGKKESKFNKDENFKFISDLTSNPIFIENDTEEKQLDVIEKNEQKFDRSLLQIEAKNLNCENEMIRMFGAKVVNADKLTKFNTIANKKSTWPEFRKTGLQMKQISTINNDEIEFAFEHLKEYQTVQFNFLDAVESLDHNNIFVNYQLLVMIILNC